MSRVTFLFGKNIICVAWFVMRIRFKYGNDYVCHNVNDSRKKICPIYECLSKTHGTHVVSTFIIAWKLICLVYKLSTCPVVYVMLVRHKHSLSLLVL